MGCACNEAKGATQKWIYQHPDGRRFELNSETEARIQVTKNGGGNIMKKQ